MHVVNFPAPPLLIHTDCTLPATHAWQRGARARAGP